MTYNVEQLSRGIFITYLLFMESRVDSQTVATKKLPLTVMFIAR